MSNLLKLNVKDLSGAIVSAVLVAVLGYVSALTNITDINFTEVLNIAILTAVASLLKSLGTDSDGKLLGSIKIK